VHWATSTEQRWTARQIFNIVSGNTNAASIIIGEKVAETIAAGHAVKLAEFVHVRRNS